MKYLRESVILRLLCVAIALSWVIPLRAFASTSSFPQCMAENPCQCGCSKYKEPWPSTVKKFHGKSIPLRVNTGDESCACPPYNKNQGRTGCLKNPALGYPGIFDLNFMSICAEEDPGSNFFTPSIKYRTQACNVGCWPLSGSLTGDGECTVVPSPYGIPTIRLCARMAKPSAPATGTPGDIDYVEETPADPGYTADVHLDFEGYLVDDNPLSNGGYDINGNPISTPDPNLQVPKICLYWDPDLLDTLASYVFIGMAVAVMAPIIEKVSSVSGENSLDPATAILEMLDPDLMDYDPAKQSNHKTNELNPIFQLLVNFAGMQAQLESSLASMIDSLPDYIKYSMMALSVTQFTLELGAWIINNLSIPVLKFIGRMNRVVIASFGCVNVPLGPFPPPYCQPLSAVMSTPVVYNICPMNVMNDGVTVVTQESTIKNPCASNSSKCSLSCWNSCQKAGTCSECTPPTPYGLCVQPKNIEARNNAVHNSIRVGFNNYIPLCSGSDTNTDDGTCVRIHGLLVPSVLSGANGNGTLPLCASNSPANADQACIVSEFLSSQCSGGGINTPSYCSNGIRVAYGMQTSMNTPTDYYDTMIPDCPLSLGQGGACQKIWGINLGAYTDLSVEFPAFENPSSDPAHDIAADPAINASPVPPAYRVSDISSIKDSSGAVHRFRAIVTRKTTQISPTGFTPQEPHQICAYEITSAGSYVAIGCVNRATPPKPQVYDCAINPQLCKSNFFAPAMIAEIAVPVDANTVDSTAGAIKINEEINLGGNDYAGYATDWTFAKQPFSGSRAILNSKSIFGNYKDNAQPYDAGYNVNNAAVYLNGIEYLNGTYQVGAEYFCLTGYKIDDCLSGKTRQNCVLSELLNSNVISCTTFTGIKSAYPSADVCNPSNNSVKCDYANPVASYNGYGGSSVSVIPCTTTFTVAGTNSKSVTNSYCYSYNVPGSQTYQNLPMCNLMDISSSCNYSSPISIYSDNNNNIVNVYSCQSGSPAVSYNCYLNNQPLCQAFTFGNARISPATNTNAALPNGYVPNIDYYNYTPGIAAPADNKNVQDVASGGAIYSSVSAKAESLSSAPITQTYSPSTCTSNKQLSNTSANDYNNMMTSCTTAQDSSQKVTNICNAVQGIVDDVRISSACQSADTNIKSILQKQFSASSVAQMQTEAANSQNVVTNLVNALNAIGNATVTNKAQTIKAQNITSTYTVQQCTASPTPFDNMMQACRTARGVSDQINAICTQAVALVTDKKTSLYEQLNNACTEAKSKIAGILSDQFNTQIVSQMQTDAVTAKSTLNALMAVINGFGGNPSLIQSIIQTERGIYNSTDVSLYPSKNGDGGAAAKINAICTQTQNLITLPDVYPTITSALKTACDTAKQGPAAAALTTLDSTIASFTQYDVSNNGSSVASNSLVQGSSVALQGGYVPPDFSKMTVRNRTDVENGLCVQIPQFSCPATTAGGATWPAAGMGEQSNGTCLPGYSPNPEGSLKAYCLLNKATKTVSLEPNVLNNACMKSGISDVVITQNFSKLRKNNGAFVTSPYPNTIAPGKIASGVHESTTQLTWNGSVTSGTSTVTFNLQDPSSIGCFNIESIGVDDYLEVKVNGTSAYIARGGGGGSIYNYVSGGGSLPKNMFETGGFWEKKNLNLDIRPLLKQGQNTIEYTLYVVGGGGLKYSMIYGLRGDPDSPCPTLNNIYTDYSLGDGLSVTRAMSHTPADVSSSKSLSDNILFNNTPGLTLNCSKNPCQGSVKTSFEVSDINSIQKFILNTVGLNNWGVVYVNDQPVYAVVSVGNGAMTVLYDIRQPSVVQHPFVKGGNPPFSSVWNTGAFGISTPVLDLVPYLRSGSNDITVVFYSYDNSTVSYAISYILTKP